MSKYEIYKPSVKAIILEIFFSVISIFIFSILIYLSIWTAIYSIFILILFIRKSKKVIYVDESKLVTIKYFVIRKEHSVDNIINFSCKSYNVRFVNFKDFNIYINENSKIESYQLIEFGFLGHLRVLKLLNLFKEKTFIDKRSFELINLNYINNEFKIRK